MHRILLLLFVSWSVSLAAPLHAQAYDKDQFISDFNKSLEIQDEKSADRAMRKGAYFAIQYCEDLLLERRNGREEASAKIDALRASWLRCFESTETFEKLERWYAEATVEMLQLLDKGRLNSSKLWGFYTDEVAKEQIKKEYQQVAQQYTELARQVESIGHEFERAEVWNLAAVVTVAMPDKTLNDRRDALFATEQFLRAREAWGFTFDEHYIRNHEWAKNEKLRIEEAEQVEKKRADAGIDPEARGIDKLVVPDKQDTLPLVFAALTDWQGELDYGQKGGPVPAFWWLASTGESGTSRRLEWFRRSELHLVRTGAAKFGVAIDPNDAKHVQEIEATPKAEPTTFWLDAEKKQPYAMFFWTGSERERVGDAECNLAPSDKYGNVYYKSAASWKTTFGGESIVLYDDDSNGTPCNADPFGAELKSPMLGEHDTEGTLVPLLDSMRIGKGPRTVFSEFVKLSSGWFHLARGGGDDIVLRPLHPEFVPMGKVKLAWAGPKPTAPVQLVIRGANEYQTAFFDLAGGKEVEVPAGTYSVVFGRMVAGKGARVQMANLYRGTSPTFEVEAGKTHVLKMGAPFTIDFTRRGDQSASIDAMKILVRESTGCVYGELHNMGLQLDVMAARSEDGKGAKAVGKFVRFTDPELVNKAAQQYGNAGTLVACFPMPDDYRGGELVLSCELPHEGMKLALVAKKHPVFGPLSSKYQ